MKVFFKRICSAILASLMITAGFTRSNTNFPRESDNAPIIVAEAASVEVRKGCFNDNFAWTSFTYIYSNNTAKK